MIFLPKSLPTPGSLRNWASTNSHRRFESTSIRQPGGSRKCECFRRAALLLTSRGDSQCSAAISGARTTAPVATGARSSRSSTGGAGRVEQLDGRFHRPYRVVEQPGGRSYASGRPQSAAPLHLPAPPGDRRGSQRPLQPYSTVAKAAAVAARAAATTAAEAAAEEDLRRSRRRQRRQRRLLLPRPRRGQQGEPCAGQRRRERSGSSGLGLVRPLPPPSPAVATTAGRDPHSQAPLGASPWAISLSSTSNECALLSPLAGRATPGLRARQRVPIWSTSMPPLDLAPSPQATGGGHGLYPGTLIHARVKTRRPPFFLPPRPPPPATPLRGASRPGPW